MLFLSVYKKSNVKSQALKGTGDENELAKIYFAWVEIVFQLTSGKICVWKQH